MWVSFAVAALFALVCLVLPGLLLLRGAGVRWDFALGVAPSVTTVVYGFLSIGYAAMGVPCGWVTLLLPSCLVGVALLVLVKRRGRERPSFGFDARLESPLRESGPLALLTPVRLALVLAVLAAVATSLAVYVLSIGDPSAFVQNYDNAWHISRVHEFAQTGNYSCLAGGYYPSAWHVIGALTESALGFSSALAEHAANLAFIIGAYPAASVILLATLFPDKPRRVVLGGALCLVLAFFPWRIMLFGPLYPNLAAFTMMPAEAGLFMLLTGRETPRRSRIAAAALFVIGGVAMVLAQPNAIFSTGAFLIPYCLWRVRELASERLSGRAYRALFSVGVTALVGAAFLAAWVALAKAPFMSSIVEYPRKPLVDLAQAIRWGLGFSFVIRRQEFAITVLAAIGALALLVAPKRRWLVFSLALLMGIYVVAVSMEGEVQHLVAGFWYSDYYRLAATVCVFCVPVIASGADAVIGAVLWVARRLAARASASRTAALVGGSCVSAAIIVAALVHTYVPLEFIDWYYRSYAFDAVAFEMRDAYQNPGNRCLDDEELAFAEQVRELVPEGELVLNLPFDGSAFAYAACDLDVVYDSFSVGQDPEGELLRTSVDEIADDPQVRVAVDEMSVSYVLLLDQADGPRSFAEGSTAYLLGYDGRCWRGITSIDEDTPGFECVLAEGDMRLYRIVS